VNVGELPAIHFAADDRDHALHISIARQAIAGLCVPHA
jgi:hypothetical protein